MPLFPVKLFVGGLSWQTEEEHLQHYFTQFGDIEAVQIMKDPFTLVSTHTHWQILVQTSWPYFGVKLSCVCLKQPLTILR